MAELLDYEGAHSEERGLGIRRPLNVSEGPASVNGIICFR